jgi:hypothetical protein
MNSNLVHNILNVLAVLIGAASFIGCTETAIGFDCSSSFIGPKWGAVAAIAFGAIKVIMNLGRDGFGGLFKQQPPVASNVTTVVVPSDTGAPATKVTVEPAKR